MKTRAFTLIEIALVTALLGLMSYLFLPSLADGIEQARIRDEDKVLEELRQEITRSFSNVDPWRNLSCLPTHAMGRSEAATVFDDRMHGGVVSGAEWFAKLERNRGGSVVAGEALGASGQGSLFHTAITPLSQRRLLFVGPDEPGQVRYLLLSIVAPPSRGLELPAPEAGVAWFDALWDHDWTSHEVGLPALWRDRLTPTQQTAWLDGRGNSTNLSCLRVLRIVQPKYRVTINNTHPTNHAWMDVDGSSDALVSAPRSGVSTSREILSGRRITIRRGAMAPGIEVLRFHLNEESSVTIQP